MKVGKVTKLYPLIKENIIEILVFKISRDDCKLFPFII